MVGVHPEGVATVDDGRRVVIGTLSVDEYTMLEKRVDDGSRAVVEEPENTELVTGVEDGVVSELVIGVEDCAASELELGVKDADEAGVELTTEDRVSDVGIGFVLELAGTLTGTELETTTAAGSILKSPIANPEPS